MRIAHRCVQTARSLENAGVSSHSILVEVPEATFHQAKTAATVLTNTAAGETFAAPGATFVRINARHFRIEGAQSHAEALALVGRSPAWRHGGGR